MPITKKWTIEKLMAALREFPLRNRERLTFEYVLLGGVNDGVQHAREMVELIRGLRAKVNLIALNPGPEIPFSTPSADRVACLSKRPDASGHSGVHPAPARPRHLRRLWPAQAHDGTGSARSLRKVWANPRRLYTPHLGDVCHLGAGT